MRCVRLILLIIYKALFTVVSFYLSDVPLVVCSQKVGQLPKIRTWLILVGWFKWCGIILGLGPLGLCCLAVLHMCLCSFLNLAFYSWCMVCIKVNAASKQAVMHNFELKETVAVCIITWNVNHTYNSLIGGEIRSEWWFCMEYGWLIPGVLICGDTISSSLSRFRDSVYGGFNGRSPGVWRTGTYVYYPQSLPSTNTHRKTYVAYRKVHLDIMFCLSIHPKTTHYLFFSCLCDG